MAAPGTDAIGMLRWGLRRYALLFIACVIAGGVLAPMVAAKLTPPVDAEALVIAQRLDMSISALPRYGEAVFDNGQVAQAVVAKFGKQGAVSAVIPNEVSIVADQDSIIFHVVGHDSDPARAAAIANTAAGAFVQALNAPGVGVGSFALQSPAVPPAHGPGPLSKAIGIPIGIVAGVVLGLALVSILLVVRRPVMDAAGVEEATGVQSLGTVVVPRTRGGQVARPDQFAGLVPVCRGLLRLPTSTVVVLSRRRDARLRRRLTVAVASVLARVRAVSFVGGDELQQQAGVGHPAGPKHGAPAPSNDEDWLTLVDGDDPLDLVYPPESTATVLAVRQGISSSALRAAVVDLLGGSAEARVVLVKNGRPTRGAAPQPSVAPPAERRPAALADGR
jgi:capsular polysaccharide biosynthesis protein